MSDKLKNLRKALGKRNFNMTLNEPDNWLSFGNHALNYVCTGSFKRAIPNRRLSMLYGISGCVDADTEFLTPTGWKRIADYEEGDQVAQFNADTHQMSFVHPTDYIKEPCSEFYHIKSKYGADQMLTPEHRVLYRTTRGNLKVRTAEEVVAMQNRDYGTGFGGRFLTTFIHPEQEGMDISDADLRLQIAVMADGFFMENRTTWPNIVRINIKKDRKKERLVSLLEASGREYKRSERNDGFSVFEFGAPIKTKVYGPEFYACSKHQLELIADECLHWDGSTTNGRKSFFSTDKGSADFIQYVFSGLGQRARILEDVREGRTTCYEVNITPRNTVGIGGKTRNKVDVVESGDGFKYCFTVPDTFLVLRRNGCVFVTGNSGKSFLMGNLAKSAQSLGYLVIYIDTEDAIDPEYLTRIGVEIDDESMFLPIRLSTIEELSEATAEIFQTFDKTDKICILVDSLGMLETEDHVDAFEKKGEMKNDMGLFAKKLKKYLKNITSKVGEYDCFFVANQHCYANQNVTDGRGTHVPSGGEAQIYIPSISLFLKKLNLKEGSEVVGVRIKAQTTKTRFTQVGMKTEVEVPYRTGLDQYDGVLDILESEGGVSRNGAWYSYVNDDGETVKFQKKETATHAPYLIEKYEPETLRENQDEEYEYDKTETEE